jgi:DNA-binding transcriptional regulator YiaG
MQERRISCHECGNKDTYVVRGSHQFTESGLLNVTLEGVELVHCGACGVASPIIPRILTIHRLLALAIAKKPHRMNGAELRYLRKYADLTADGLGRLLHVHKSTVSKWENGEDQISHQSDRLIRLTIMALAPDLKDQLPDVVRQTFERIGSDEPDLKIAIHVEEMDYAYA